ncbi:hypothetical protein [Beijerinckia indica]|uniref:Uncharacterized protein n=1 Tax=Beijerinckia indica subsp. indica (strain ATCC 9039 / DSM 1715 / NCIMB 8712) TaxID=395963 RepID=B2IHJ9_BEII9|nr:hypothetical protein [Beijerinckia indica]ACB94520.1 hypothetical protein Bind_0870 [Beijerinckia indica subsp. indica ATCC 9039]
MPPINRPPFALPLLFLAGAWLLPVQPAQAGFFEALFGLENNEPRISVMPAERHHTIHHPSPKKRPKMHARVHAAPKPVIMHVLTGEPMQALMRDTTLQQGDVVMTPKGLRIFMGESESPHEAKDFLALSALSGRKARHKELLTAIDSARANPIFPPRQEVTDDLASGRSVALDASVSIPIALRSETRPFIRYVGP